MISKPATGIASFGAERPGFLLGLSLYDPLAGIGGLAFLTIYLALFYLTLLLVVRAGRGALILFSGEALEVFDGDAI